MYFYFLGPPSWEWEKAMLKHKERAGNDARRPQIHAPTDIGARAILLAKNWDGKAFYHHNFNNLSFIDCNLSECLFYACRFQNCHFEDVCFAKSMFIDCVFLGCSGSQLDFDHSICQSAQFCPLSRTLFSTNGLIEAQKIPMLHKSNQRSGNYRKYIVFNKNSTPDSAIFVNHSHQYHHSRIQPKIKTYFAKIKDDRLI